ncbi:MAG: stage II sporulation protein R [Oscillospiraceae bacterium]|nr:stage II sporulation protein R [Oscillospiraceae bacterium]
MKTNRLLIAMITGLIFTLSVSFSDIMEFKKNLSDIESNVLRLHIIANSDSEQDQSLKLMVRDGILSGYSEIFENSDGIDEIVKTAKEHLSEIEKTAEKIIRENGFFYDVSCEVVKMDFDKKDYENFTMPKGFYNALRIKIGSAEGKNWWCVMYPPLCVPATTEADLSEYLTEEEIDIITNPKRYEVRFKCVEIYEKLFGHKNSDGLTGR